MREHGGTMREHGGTMREHGGAMREQGRATRDYEYTDETGPSARAEQRCFGISEEPRIRLRSGILYTLSLLY